MLQRPRRFELSADTAHGPVQNDAVKRLIKSRISLPESDEKSNCAAERFSVEKRREIRRRVAPTERIEEGDAVIDNGVNVGYMSHEAIGEAMALMIDCADGETVLGEVNGGELNEPAGLAGESVNDADDADGVRGREWGPPLSEEFETSRIGDELGAVTH